MKQTSIEWLYKNLLDNPLSNEDVIYNINVFEQAKELHKQETIEAYESGNYENGMGICEPEQYYNETYKK